MKTPSAVNLHIFHLMMEAEILSETLGFYPQPTRFFTREFIGSSRREIFKSYYSLS
jgi:hypothetical protein